MKKIQSSIAKIIKSENQKTASKMISNTIIKIVIPIHKSIDKINPPIPSPTSIEGVSKVGEAFLIISPLF
ncbi:MAG: hypothetical protein ACJA1B_001845 [Polaribacter sp.]